MAALNKKLTEEFCVVEMANITGPGKSFSGGLLKSAFSGLNYVQFYHEYMY